jgi:hypothetical protein
MMDEPGGGSERQTDSVRVRQEAVAPARSFGHLLIALRALTHTAAVAVTGTGGFNEVIHSQHREREREREALTKVCCIGGFLTDFLLAQPLRGRTNSGATRKATLKITCTCIVTTSIGGIGRLATKDNSLICDRVGFLEVVC